MDEHIAIGGPKEAGIRPNLQPPDKAGDFPQITGMITGGTSKRSLRSDKISLILLEVSEKIRRDTKSGQTAPVATGS